MLCSLNNDLNHSKQQQKPTPLKLYFNNRAKEGGFIAIFSVINFTFKLLNCYCCAHRYIYIYIYMYIYMYIDR